MEEKILKENVSQMDFNKKGVLLQNVVLQVFSVSWQIASLDSHPDSPSKNWWLYE